MYRISINFFRYPKWFFVVLRLLLVPVFFFCLFYLLSGYESLKNWYLGLNNCLYLPDEWAARFFSPAVKSQGNFFALLGALFAVAGLVYFAIRVNCKTEAETEKLTLKITLADSIYLAVIVVFGLALWLWGSLNIPPAYDEVFSAIFCAELPLFQGISYYMLPNNHLYFNAINKVLFFFSSDKVFSGRMLSGFAYVLVLILVFLWLHNITKSRVISFVSVLVLALQFPIWGFAVQARGYGIYALAHWLAFISLFQYLKSLNANWLIINTSAIVLGYAMVPSFLYFHAAIIAFAFLHQLLYNTPDLRFWKYQACSLVAVFFLLLPAILFSGIKAFVANEYVSPASDGAFVFFRSALPVIEGFAAFSYSDFSLAGQPLHLFLLVLPAVFMFANRTSIWFKMGCLNLIMVLAVLFFILIMKRVPFHRNLVGHFSIGLTMFILSVFWLVGMLPGILKPSIVQRVVVPCIMLIFAWHFFKHDPISHSQKLYVYNVEAHHQRAIEAIKLIPAGATISFSHSAYYIYYLLRKNGFPVNNPCLRESTDYLIVSARESIPSQYQANFMQLYQLKDYKIFRHKKAAVKLLRQDQ